MKLINNNKTTFFIVQEMFKSFFYIYNNSFQQITLIMNIQKNIIYFQKQSALSAQCGVCAVNNLLGTEYFSSADLDNICNQLSENMINPYKSVFGGDYDVSVLIKALQRVQRPVRWLKKSEKIQQVLSNDLLKGILINTQQKDKSFFKKLIDRSGRHWVCLKKNSQDFILLDSMKEQPLTYNKQYAVTWLKKIRQEGVGQVKRRKQLIYIQIIQTQQFPQVIQPLSIIILYQKTRLNLKIIIIYTNFLDTMTNKVQKLTSLGISKMLEDDAEDEAIIVQVFDISSTKNGRVICTVSDGDFCTKAYLNDDSIVKPGQDQFTVICIKGHAKLKNNIGVTNLKLVAKYPQKLGTPHDWTSSKQNAVEIKSKQQFKLQKIIKTQPKKVQMPSAAKTTIGKDEGYESIDDLHVGLLRWSLLCRITRKSFKQSSKKGTKVLEIQLVDKSKKKILGTFFRQAAVDFNDYLKQGSVYQISKGRLIEGNYNNSKNDKLSPYSLIFDQKSQFNEVSDVNIIVKSQDTAITLGKVYEKRVIGQQFDIVAYVVEVKPQTSIQKEDKSVTIKEVVLADPESQITMNAKLWRWNQQFGNQMVGKVVIFSRFLLYQYKGSLNLNSGIRSSIIHNHGHPMKKYQNKNIDTTGFTVTTEIRERVEEDTSDFCYDTLELNQKIRRMSEGQTIKSIISVWISRFAYLKKWNYNGCPKCRKVAEKYSKCGNPNCGYAIQQTTVNFSMGLEVSDLFGSFWVTAYDQFAKKIFQNMGPNAASQLNELQKDDLGQKLQNYLYQPFRLKIFTKKNQQGRVTHTANRILDLQEQRVARQNLKKINLLLGR